MGCEVEWIPLGDIVNISSGGTPDKKQTEYWNGEIPWISAKTLTGDTVTTSNNFITKKGLQEGSKLAPVDSILLLTRGSGLFKRIPLAIVGAPVAYNQDVKCLTSKVATISNRYVFYALKAQSSVLSNMLETTGIGAGKLATDRLLGMPIPVLSCDVRDKVESFFSVLSRKIELIDQLNDYLLELASTIFKTWFMNDDARYSTNKVAISEIAVINAGGDKPDVCQKTPSNKCPVPVYSNGTDNEGLYGYTSMAKVTEPSVTVSARGTIGFTCLRHQPYYPIVRLISATPKEGITVEYLYLWLRNKMITGVGTTQQQLTVPMFKKYEIDVPSAKNLTKFTEIVRPLFNAIAANKTENTELVELRNTLLPKLTSGEIDVSKIDVAQLNK